MFSVLGALRGWSAGIENVTVIPERSGQGGALVAMGQQNALAIWSDYRTYEDFISEVFATRVTPSGAPLDPQGIRLSDAKTGGYALAALGDIFLVVWNSGSQLYARRINSAGNILDANPILISVNSSHPVPESLDFEPTAASDGKSFWVAWVDYRNAPANTPEYRMWNYQDIYAARISADGQVLDVNGIKISARPGQQSSPQLSRGGDFIIWRESGVRGARLAAQGICLDPGGFLIATSDNPAFSMGVAGNDQGWLAVLGDETRIRAIPVRRDATVSAPFRVARTTQNGHPKIENCGSDYLIWWQSGTDTLAAKVRASGDVSQAGVLASSADPLYDVTSLAQTGNSFVAVGATVPAGANWMSMDVWLGACGRDTIPSIPPRITQVVRAANGFRITFTATKGATYRIEAASNLATRDWVALADVVATNRVVTWTDRRDRKPKTGLYRVRELAK